jgi:Tol biopolymer transport system component/tRNA A-37 threonylcarbamoyl transferase component Bud32
MKSPDVQDRLQQALGPAYVFERELAGGGMSRVFVADEAALGRKVVVKVLRPGLAEGLSTERFKREVRLAARLLHPHVVPLLAAGELDGGVLYYTMPFVEGETLRARLEHVGALTVNEAVRVLHDVASALAYAHEQGIVHRDIKPENILLSHGSAVVADFGIAKAIRASIEQKVADAGRHNSTLTAAGTSLGTPAYMSPEQASGDLVDHRADLYALGVVAYEMLAGRAPFEGRNTQQLLAAQATQVPEPIQRRRPSAPAALGALVMRLLEKHPADRPQSADEVLAALDGIAESPTVSGANALAGDGTRTGARRVSSWLIVGAVAAVVGAFAGAAFVARRAASVEITRPVIAAITAPPDHELRPDASQALTTDGSQLAFVAADARGATAIWIRPLDDLTATRVDGTEGGTGPFFSPDGTSIGFFAAGQLRVADLRSGTQRALCPAPRPGGGTWTTSGTIVYSPGFLGVPLFRVPAAGGPCTQLTRNVSRDFDHRRPSALPDGKHVIFSSFRANVALVVDLATGETREVRKPGNEAQFAPPNWLLFREAAGSNSLQEPIYAQRLDMSTLRSIGEPRIVLDRTSGGGGLSRFSAASRALVAIRPSGKPLSLLWVNRQSAIVDSIVVPADAGPIVNAANFGISHDGRSVAIGGMGMWIHGRDRNVATRVRAEGIAGQGLLDPAWSPGDSLVAYGTVFTGPLMLRVYNVARGTSDSLFSVGWRDVRAPDWSPDGRRIAFQLSAGASVPRDEIWVYSLADRRAVHVFESEANLSSPRWSPDGRWMAYVSNASGAPEVYVRRVDGAGVEVPVSTAGGAYPRWRTDGRELFYRAPDGSIMAVDVRLGDAAALSRPRVVVSRPPFNQTTRDMDVTPDGQEFIAYGRGEPPVFTLLLDWAARLPKR